MPEKAATTTVARDALPWSHIDLTTTLLELAVAQIRHAMADNDETMLALAQAHQAIGAKLQAIATALTSTSADGETVEDTQSNINQSLGQMIMAFQGHDALNQRLEHVCLTLEALRDHIGDEALRENESAWSAMVDEMERRYTIKDERALFRKIMKREEEGTPPEADDGDIELF